MGDDNNIKKKDDENNSENEIEINTVKNERAQKDDNKEVQEQEKSDEPDIEELKKQLKEKTNKCQEYFERLQRTAAEFDNYRKRVIREKENFYGDVLSEIVNSFLPVVDNIERAVSSSDNGESGNSLKEGVELVLKQLKQTMKTLGVEEIECKGEKFNPEYHEAVEHIEDESYDDNVIIEELQKGYKYKDKVIRYSIVKVAN